ncbi:MAG: response regulator [Pseudanabaenales cyanobacterium]|nr:response regulator [Pseudanabaenales cyanobacterium]
MALKNSIPLTAKILIVEDAEFFACHLRQTLEEFGHQVLSTVASGEEAIKMAAAAAPDLVLMDICLEGNVDGITAAAEIYMRLNIPVVYLTAYTDEETLQRALATYPFGYLTKPLQEKELHTTINVALHRHRLEQRLRMTQSSQPDSTRMEGSSTLIHHIAPISCMDSVSEDHCPLARAQSEPIPPITLRLPPPQFPSPQFRFGQKVRTNSGVVGYISGMVFYPDLKSWNYGLYLTNADNGEVCGKIDEIWYISEELMLDSDL